MSWQNLLAENKLNTDSKRTLVIAKPKMNFSAMLPSELAQNFAHETIKAIKLQYPSVSIRITGETALEHEELQTVSSGAEISGIVSFLLVCIIPMDRCSFV